MTSWEYPYFHEEIRVDIDFRLILIQDNSTIL
jgi:hypothetical protein